MDEGLKSRFSTAGQDHVFEYWDSLKDEEKKGFAEHLKGLDLGYLENLFKSSMSHNQDAKESQATVKPWRQVITLKSALGTGAAHEPSRAAAIRRGLDLIAEGGLAVLLLAGGQGTRLGSALPKGCYDIGLGSHKSLFQIHAERIRNMETLAAAWADLRSKRTESNLAIASPSPESYGVREHHAIPWLVMTSPFTHVETVAHFKAHGFFGLEESQVIFFQQDGLPCFDESGKLILESPSSIARAPDGNGGVYLALRRSGALAELKRRGVRAVDCFCVDNALARPADPITAGAFLGAGAKCGSRTVARLDEGEKVGVFAGRTAQSFSDDASSSPAQELVVLEYSELNPKDASAFDDEDGDEAAAVAPDVTEAKEAKETKETKETKAAKGARRLKYNWANICMHYFTLDFLEEVADRLEGKPTAAAAAAAAATSSPLLSSSSPTSTMMPYHVARKKIPAAGGASVAGVKLELFIFDVFFMAAEAVAVAEIERSDNFAPVKNAPGSSSDCPETARAAMQKLHAKWIHLLAAPEGSGKEAGAVKAKDGKRPREDAAAEEDGTAKATEDEESAEKPAKKTRLEQEPPASAAATMADSTAATAPSGSSPVQLPLGLARLIREKLKGCGSTDDVSDSDLEILVEATALTEWP